MPKSDRCAGLVTLPLAIVEMDVHKNSVGTQSEKYGSSTVVYLVYILVCLRTFYASYSSLYVGGFIDFCCFLHSRQNRIVEPTANRTNPAMSTARSAPYILHTTFSNDSTQTIVSNPEKGGPTLKQNRPELK